MCEHEFKSLRTADGSFCMTACRKCMKSTGEIETLAKTEPMLTAANARIAELENQKPSYKKEFDCVYEKLKAEESLSKHYNQRAEQAEAQCAAMQAAINRYVLGHIELLGALKAALEVKPSENTKRD